MAQKNSNHNDSYLNGFGGGILVGVFAAAVGGIVGGIGEVVDLFRSTDNINHLKWSIPGATAFANVIMAGMTIDDVKNHKNARETTGVCDASLTIGFGSAVALVEFSRPGTVNSVINYLQAVQP